MSESVIKKRESSFVIASLRDLICPPLWSRARPHRIAAKEKKQIVQKHSSPVPRPSGGGFLAVWRKGQEILFRFIFSRRAKRAPRKYIRRLYLHYFCPFLQAAKNPAPEGRSTWLEYLCTICISWLHSLVGSCSIEHPLPLYPPFCPSKTCT